jgi:hypothetical protein
LRFTLGPAGASSAGLRGQSLAINRSLGGAVAQSSLRGQIVFVCLRLISLKKCRGAINFLQSLNSHQGNCAALRDATTNTATTGEAGLPGPICGSAGLTRMRERRRTVRALPTATSNRESHAGRQRKRLDGGPALLTGWRLIARYLFASHLAELLPRDYVDTGLLHGLDHLGIGKDAPVVVT